MTVITSQIVDEFEAADRTESKCGAKNAQYAAHKTIPPCSGHPENWPTIHIGISKFGQDSFPWCRAVTR
jgi:hypothetical protein